MILKLRFSKVDLKTFEKEVLEYLNKYTISLKTDFFIKLVDTVLLNGP